LVRWRTAHGPQSEAVQEQGSDHSGIAAWGVCDSEVEGAAVIDTTCHGGCLVFSVEGVVLDDAEGVDPEVAEAEALGQRDYVPHGLGEG